MNLVDIRVSALIDRGTTDQGAVVEQARARGELRGGTRRATRRLVPHLARQGRSTMMGGHERQKAVAPLPRICTRRTISPSRRPARCVVRGIHPIDIKIIKIIFSSQESVRRGMKTYGVDRHMLVGRGQFLVEFLTRVDRTYLVFVAVNDQDL